MSRHHHNNPHRYYPDPVANMIANQERVARHQAEMHEYNERQQARYRADDARRQAWMDRNTERHRQREQEWAAERRQQAAQNRGGGAGFVGLVLLAVVTLPLWLPILLIDAQLEKLGLSGPVAFCTAGIFWAAVLLGGWLLWRRHRRSRAAALALTNEETDELPEPVTDEMLSLPAPD
jgi:hypothetical protein